MLDVSEYDGSTVAVLLQEGGGDSIPVLALLSLASIPDDKFTAMPSENL